MSCCTNCKPDYPPSPTLSPRPAPAATTWNTLIYHLPSTASLIYLPLPTQTPDILQPQHFPRQPIESCGRRISEVSAVSSVSKHSLTSAKPQESIITPHPQSSSQNVLVGPSFVANHKASKCLEENHIARALIEDILTSWFTSGDYGFRDIQNRSKGDGCRLCGIEGFDRNKGSNKMG